MITNSLPILPEVILNLNSKSGETLVLSNYCHLTEALNFNFYRYAVEFVVEDGKITSINKLDNGEERNIRVNQVFTKLLLGCRS